MRNKILVPECVQVMKSIVNWKEVFDLCMKPMIEKGYVTANYAESILYNLKKCPNDFVFEDIMIPHTKPEKGVIRSGISILVSKNRFYTVEKGADIQIMIVMASKS